MEMKIGGKLSQHAFSELSRKKETQESRKFENKSSTLKNIKMNFHSLFYFWCKHTFWVVGDLLVYDRQSLVTHFLFIVIPILLITRDCSYITDQHL